MYLAQTAAFSASALWFQKETAVSGHVGDLVGSPAPYFSFWIIRSEKEDNKVKVHLGLTLTWLLNSLPDYKILDLSKLKQIADDTSKCI